MSDANACIKSTSGGVLQGFALPTYPADAPFEEFSNQPFVTFNPSELKVNELYQLSLPFVMNATAGVIDSCTVQIYESLTGGITGTPLYSIIYGVNDGACAGIYSPIFVAREDYYYTVSFLFATTPADQSADIIVTNACLVGLGVSG